MSVFSLKYYCYVLILAALFINENIIQWILAVVVGHYSVKDAYIDAFEHFSIGGYAFLTAFRSIPYFILWFAVKSYVKKESSMTVGIAWGGLIGILFMIVWGSWTAQHAYYTNEHVSSTTAIAFLFIPIYSIVTGLIGGFSGGLGSYVSAK
ncbi:MAG: hypothetical protein HRT77_03920 [Halioglobus sp.]|nr:hypothetical protein [Halioglobus sp.]